MVVVNSAEPTLFNPRLPRYLRYRNARLQAPNLWVCEVGMGAKPRVWRIAYITKRPDDHLAFRGWVHKVREDFFKVFWRYPYRSAPSVEAKFETYKQAHDFLVMCANHFGGD